MDGKDFVSLCRSAFEPFLNEQGFVMESFSISGRMYEVIFAGEKHAILVSYEPGDDMLFVLVFGRENDTLTDFDDRTKTPRLADLNAHYMAKVSDEERRENEAVFTAINPRDKQELTVLKAAKELRLVLPKYLRSKSA
jgi:hypothetical protein